MVQGLRHGSQANKGRKEKKCILYFAEQNVKPMVCNLTNRKTLAKLYHTVNSEKLKGKRVTIGTDTADGTDCNSRISRGSDPVDRHGRDGAAGGKAVSVRRISRLCDRNGSDGAAATGCLAACAGGADVRGVLPDFGTVFSDAESVYLKVLSRNNVVLK